MDTNISHLKHHHHQQQQQQQYQAVLMRKNIYMNITTFAKAKEGKKSLQQLNITGLGVQSHVK